MTCDRKLTQTYRWIMIIFSSNYPYTPCSYCYRCQVKRKKIQLIRLPFDFFIFSPYSQCTVYDEYIFYKVNNPETMFMEG